MQPPADHPIDSSTLDTNFFALDINFFGKTNETYKRYVFNTRNQKDNETVDDYISALHPLASTCNFCDCLKDSLLRDRIILGIKDSSTRKRLLQEADLNLETCITMCRAAEATSLSQPVKTVTRTEDTTAVQAGSVSSGDQRPSKEQDVPLSLSCYDQTASPDEEEMSEVDFNSELDDADDLPLQWTTEEHQSSGVPSEKTEHNKQEPTWSMDEDSPDQSSAVYSTAQPMSDNTCGSLLSQNTSRVCQSSTPDRYDAGKINNADIDKDAVRRSTRKTAAKNETNENCTSVKDGKSRSRQNVCDVCEMSFSKPSALIQHKLVHSGVKSFACDLCNKRYGRAHDLKRHKLRHIGFKPFACNMCSESFYCASILKRHCRQMHSSRKPFVCDICGESFTKAGNLNTHRKVHSEERPHKCPVCNKKFKSAGHLKEHIQTIHEGARPYVCDVCGAAFTQSGNLRKHRRIHSGEKPYVCSDCGKAFGRSDDLEKHCITCLFSQSVEPGWSMEEDSPDQPSAVYSTVQPVSDNASGSLLSLNTSHLCQHCSAAFVLVSSLELHLASVHGEKLYMVLPGSSTPDRCDAGSCDNADVNKDMDCRSSRKTTKKEVDDDEGNKDEKRRSRQHVCDVCGKAFHTHNLMKTHKVVHKAEKSFTCDLCNKRFAQSSHLQKHKQRHSDDKPFVCDTCGKGFTVADYLEKHKKRVHPEERPYGCSQCDKKFKRASHLQEHIKSVHEGARPFVCDICGTALSTVGNLTIHMRIHTGEKPYVCSGCGKCFKRSEYLSNHRITCLSSQSLEPDKQVDSGHKSFVCEVCGKSFTDVRSLTRHESVHSEERPHKCPVCDKAYKTASNLKDHTRSVHESTKRYVCDVCGATFTQRGGLTTHLRIHTGEKPYVCSDCGKAFRRSDDLQVHQGKRCGKVMKPIKCPECGRGFASARNLKQHRRIHTGDISKPHVCEHCGLGCTSAKYLWQHLRIHTGEKPYVCFDCGKAFTQSSTLSQHRRKHTGQKPHSCPHCPSAFRWHLQLKKHLQAEHQ